MFTVRTALAAVILLSARSSNAALHGVSREVYLINGQQPGPLIEIDEGDELEVFVKNDLPVESTIHWHGLLQRGTPGMDGVPGVTQFPIAPGGNFTYRFSVENEYGFYWYHSHFRAYYNDAIRGPLMIHPSSSRRRPFESLAKRPAELEVLLRAERDAPSVLLNDWTHSLSDSSREWPRQGSVPPESVLKAGTGLGLSPTSSTMVIPSMQMRAAAATSDVAAGSMASDMSMAPSPISHPAQAAVSSSTMEMPSMSTMLGMSPAMDSLSPRGCMPPMMFKPGFNISSLPPESCTNTTSGLLTIPANNTQGWLALNLVNAGSVLYLALGQRYSVMIKLDLSPGNYFLRFATYPAGDMQQVLEDQAIISYSGSTLNNTSTSVMNDPASVWMLTNGSAKGDVAALNPSLLSPFDGNKPPTNAADLTKSFAISQTGVTEWVIDGYPFAEPTTPILLGNVSDGWQTNTTIYMPFNSTIDIIMTISKDSMDKMGHPMHLHGHKFWVLGSGEGPFPYTSVIDAPQTSINLQDPPYRDTAELPPSGWIVIRYVTDNPGAWLLHCHLQWHLVSGMALVLVEGEEQIAKIVNASNTSTDATSDSTTSHFDARRHATMFTALGLLLILI
ncbi:hypothetical protein V493_00559 [Pseudogymnoascus sp. VKM F-4281 (FW-2241)]|nr:hypothetical protein V493_00559 [Pseudogymnoascus sp. VKM F-4281 (FW-2241)]